MENRINYFEKSIEDNYTITGICSFYSYSTLTFLRIIIILSNNNNFPPEPVVVDIRKLIIISDWLNIETFNPELLLCIFIFGQPPTFLMKIWQ